MPDLTWLWGRGASERLCKRKLRGRSDERRKHLNLPHLCIATPRAKDIADGMEWKLYWPRKIGSCHTARQGATRSAIVNFTSVLCPPTATNIARSSTANIYSWLTFKPLVIMFGLSSTTGTPDGKGLVIIVHGASSTVRTAERAIVFIHVSTYGKDQDTVSNAAMATIRQLQALFTEISPRTESGEPTADSPVPA
jgi:hypothetical protein